jgi:hypothetical protein
MRTIRQIGIVFLLVFLLSGCMGYKSFYGDPELIITPSGSMTRSSTEIKIDAVNFTMRANPDLIHWYYDVSDGENEYIIVEYRGDNDSPTGEVYLHLRKSKKSSETNK